MANKVFDAARKNKNDEFYTKLETIEQELLHYIDDFNDKIVYCNADDPYESNFFHYFILNFDRLNLKKLVTTSYAGSSIVGKQLFFEDIVGFKNKKVEKLKTAYKVEIDRKYMKKLSIHEKKDVKSLMKNNPEIVSELKGDNEWSPGDFRSRECVEILKGVDIVVTNPPFSLFRKYFKQLMEYEKKFLIMASIQQLTYKYIFPFFMEGKIQTGFTYGSTTFELPDHYTIHHKINEDGKKEKTLGNICWVTNLFKTKMKDPLNLTCKYTPSKYPKFLGSNVINVNTLKEIPCDYDGEMGVPSSILLVLNPKQFEILGSHIEFKRFKSFILHKLDQNGSPTEKTFESGRYRFFLEYDPNYNMKTPKAFYEYIEKDTKKRRIYRALSARVVIKVRK